ncbi:MAG TPA: ABC transporter permease [Woeseiaceae bacterium]|nr:ABC transporter permease [Woeseiaceae bacterium]
MISAVELFVGLRYLRAKRRTKFVSFITLISLLGIALGVAALIVILSVMNGFEAELRTRLLSMTAHGYVTGSDGRVQDWESLHAEIVATPGVHSAAPVIEMEGMIRSGRVLTAVMVHGVLPEYERETSGDVVNYVEGSLDVLEPDARHIVLGRSLAFDLGVSIGDGLVLLMPRPSGDGGMEPVLERFIVRGVFEAGVQEHDSSLALVHASDAGRLMALGGAMTSVRFRADDLG